MPANRLLPLRSPIKQEEGVKVVGINESAADEVFEALSASTAREILAALYEDPDTASGVADIADTSLQNATYHLEKLVDAQLVEVADTWYSAQGREMKVYSPASKSLVLFASDEPSTPSIKDRLKRVLGAVGVLGVASVVVQRLAEQRARTSVNAGGGPGQKYVVSMSGDAGSNVSAGDPASAMGSRKVSATSGHVQPEMGAQAGSTLSSELGVKTGADISSGLGLPPGLLFFLGGLLVLSLVFGYAWWHSR